jgi:hypothetical protein
MNLPKSHDPKTLKHHTNLDQSLNLKNLMHHTNLHKNLNLKTLNLGLQQVWAKRDMQRILLWLLLCLYVDVDNYK